MHKFKYFLSHISVVKQGWAIYRKRKILNTHKKVAAYCDSIIKEYFEGKIEQYNIGHKKENLSNNVIWQYWGQGFNTAALPEMVQFCLDSVEKYKGDYQIIRLDDESIKDYIDLPPFVWEKKRKGVFSRTFFSDLLRLALLTAYGGIWIDATILLTKPVPENFLELAYFVYQRSDEDLKQRDYWERTYAFYWGWDPAFKVRMLSSIFFAKKNCKVVSTLLDLLLFYWKSEDHLIDYFLLQILYNELLEEQLKDLKCPVVSDTLPHLLQTKINNGLNNMTYDEILDITGIHKMSYKENNALPQVKKLLHL